MPRKGLAAAVPVRSADPDATERLPFVVPSAIAERFRELAAADGPDGCELGAFLGRVLCRSLRLPLPPRIPITESSAGRPPTGTKSGKSIMRVPLVGSSADAVREAAARDRRELGPYIAHRLCDALGLELPPPGKRGPKPAK